MFRSDRRKSLRTPAHRRSGVATLLALACLSPTSARADDAALLRSREQYALTHAGDARRGRELFRQEKTTRCLVCHEVGDEGGAVGPNLSAIGGKFDRPHLIESVLEPSKQIVEGYRPTVVQLGDGRTITGVVAERSADQIVLLDAEAQRHVVGIAEIERRKESDASLMPDGLWRDLSPQDLADLVAYLETLRPGGKSGFGGDVRGPLELPDGYAVSVVATGLDGATALETLGDGRVLVCEQTGAVRVVANDTLLETPLLRLAVDSSWERGLIGVTVDPRFAAEPFVYVCYVVKVPYPHHRVSRFRVAGNVADPASEQVLLEGDNQTKMGGNVPNGHQGGALHFGADGCLYVAIGEQTAGQPAQRLDTLLGKILRIHRDGSIPADNPFVAKTEGKYRAIWAYGCRNPFTFAIRKSDGLMLINDVGGKFEEINVGRAGANYGWPLAEHGPGGDAEAIAPPIHWYPQASISGGDFSPHTGEYFFADFVHGWIKSLDPAAAKKVKPFAAGLRRPVDMRFAKDGSLYVLPRNAWVIDGKFEKGTGSLLRITRSR